MTRQLKVLIADNSITMRKFIFGLLSEAFMLDANHSQEVDNTLSAIEAAKMSEFDLITLDLYMLPKSGIFAAQSIRDAGITTPILLITSEVNPERLEEARQAGVNDCLTKPIHPEDLREKVESLLQIGTA